jgi:hypothetical protein
MMIAIAPHFAIIDILAFTLPADAIAFDAASFRAFAIAFIRFHSFDITPFRLSSPLAAAEIDAFHFFGFR